MSISLKELLGSHTINELSHEQQVNLEELRKRLEELQAAVSGVNGAYMPFKINSGFRSPQDQARINPGVKNSKHMSGQAADIADPDGALKEILKLRPHLLEDAGLWCESFDYTKTWVHAQSVPPRSGKRWFIP